MANHDLRSNIVLTTILDKVTDTGTSIVSDIYDAKNDTQIMFIFAMQVVIAGATITVSKIEEGNDAALSDASDIPTDRIIGNVANVEFTNSSDIVRSLGVFGNKRYLRITLAVDTPGAGSNFAIFAASVPYLLPAIEHDQ